MKQRTLINVTKYKNYIVINAKLKALKDKNFIPAGNGNFGCLLRVEKKDKWKIGISKEAFEALNNIQNGHDAIGDIDCFKSGDDGVVFGWIGGLKTYWKVGKKLETSRDADFKILEDVVQFIPNRNPKAFIEVIEKSK